MANEMTNQKKSGLFLGVIKGAIIAVFISLVLVLLFAVVVKFTNISSSAIKPINQVIKGVSILIGVIFGVAKNKTGGLVKGIIVGVIYTILSFAVFSILDGSFSINFSFVTDLIFSAITGAIAGVIAVNIGKK